MSRVSELWSAAHEMVAEIGLWLAVHDGKEPFLRFTREDQVRLLRLKTWQLRYYLSIQEILSFVVPVLRSTVKRKSKRWALGITVRSLTGEAAERILQEQLKKTYPGGEHIQVWKDREQENQIEVEQMLEGDLVSSGKTIDVLHAESLEDYVSRYRARIQHLRQERSAQMRKHRKKPYRWNPFN